MGCSSISPQSWRDELKPEDHASKKRKQQGEKTVVRVKIEANEGNQEKTKQGPPHDSWSWRKYGQKPIKGSPFPRGYYRCSTEKGCPAKKQIERCKEDASMLTITYTSAHNHPGPEIQARNPARKAQPPESKALDRARASPGRSDEQPTTPEQPSNSKDSHEYCSPSDQGQKGHLHRLHHPNHNPSGSHMTREQEGEEPYVVTLDNFTPHNHPLNGLFSSADGQPLLGGAFTGIEKLTAARITEEDYDFFDEFDELKLPTSASLTGFIKRSNPSAERMFVHPS